ncbi:hypothetical protein CC80DRAFT_508999 [Byssothecium circinans]|uniref:Uncharacterized protein n=1 Tax=Byssothecium circinans TaxID=147558 RepID=A0A6A5TGX7_9PLEO|nr:hypothetical protein CC80DRAFT_508999 [Byssothecium circinans]
MSALLPESSGSIAPNDAPKVAASPKIIIFVDIPDPDNLYMIIYLLRRYQNTPLDGKVCIVLSPRILDLRAPHYGPHFRKLLHHCEGIENLAFPILNQGMLEERIQDVPEEYRQWFYIDEDYAGAESIQEDTELYMEVSILRFVYALTLQGFSTEQYQIYWDRRSLGKSATETSYDQLGDPAIRHAFHVHDFRYGFNGEKKESYAGIVKEYQGHPSDELRGRLRPLLDSHVKRMLTVLKQDEPKNFYEDFDALIEDCHDSKRAANAHLFIGGPFTEAWRYIYEMDGDGDAPAEFQTGTRRGDLPVEVTAMAWSIDNSINIFPEQFNLYADSHSAQAIFRMIETRGTPCRIIPTDSIKQTDYHFKWEDTVEIFGRSKYLSNLVENFDRDTGGDHKDRYWCNFDGIAAVAHDMPELFDWVPMGVKMTLEKTAAGNQSKRVINDFVEKKPSKIKIARYRGSTNDEVKQNLKRQVDELHSGRPALGFQRGVAAQWCQSGYVRKAWLDLGLPVLGSEAGFEKVSSALDRHR